jgi:hypothetical protein
VVLEAVFENDTRRFEQCHPGWKRPTDADAAAARKRAKDKPRTLLRRWIVCAPATTLPTAQPNEIQVRVLDADTANAGGGGDDGYTTFYVLGASEEQAVLGTTHQGETHLRLVSTCFLPLDTMTAVFKCRRHMADASYSQRYQAGSFLPVVFQRPAAETSGGGSVGLREPALLITDGPLKGMAVNEAMRGELLKHVSWKSMPNGERKTLHFQVAADDLKALPYCGASAAAQGVTVRRYGLRGSTTSDITVADIAEVMRAPETVLPYWLPTKTCQGVPRLLQTLQSWLAPLESADTAASPPVVTTVHALTLCALTAVERSTQRRSTLRARAADPQRSSPLFILCNGHTRHGVQQVTWAEACKCRCRCALEDAQAAGLTPKQLKKARKCQVKSR